MRRILTLVIVKTDTHVLLGMKKRGFGQGKWNGFGGKVQEGESIKDACSRELYEEAGITPTDLKELGILEFTFSTNDDHLEVHIFVCTTYSGEVGESEEMKPEWFPITEIPFSKMWTSDAYWFPLFLEGKEFRGNFHFDADENAESHELIIL